MTEHEGGITRRCEVCKTEWRETRYRRDGVQPSALTIENKQLKAELNALQEENAMLRCRLEELEP